MARITHRLFGSVFTKLLAVILLTGLGIQMAVGIFFWYFRSEAGREYSQTLAHYLTLVVSEIGNPPDFDKASALADAGAFHLRYTDPSWIGARPRMYRRACRSGGGQRGGLSLASAPYFSAAASWSNCNSLPGSSFSRSARGGPISSSPDR